MYDIGQEVAMVSLFHLCRIQGMAKGFGGFLFLLGTGGCRGCAGGL